jgi:hypothetical protein
MLKRLLLLLFCSWIFFVTAGCKGVKGHPPADETKFINLQRNSIRYIIERETDKSDIGEVVGVIVPLKGNLSEMKNDTWYSQNFREGDKIYKFKTEDVNKSVVVETGNKYIKLISK